MIRKLFCLFLLLFSSSCTLHKPYMRPELELPDQWRNQTNAISTCENSRWWELLNDCVLNALIEEALENNQDLRIAAARVLEYYDRLGIVRADLFPLITFNGSATRSQASLETMPPVPGIRRINNLFAWSLNLSYELDLWGRVQSATEAALADLLGQIETRRTVVLSLVAAVANSYILLCQYDKQLNISKQTLVSRVESYKLAKLRFEGGLTSELEVKQSQSEIETAAAQVKELEIAIPQQENLLSILIGHYPQAICRGLGIDALQLPPYISEGIPSEILGQRPDIRQAEFALMAANARIGEARALFFPSISLTGAYGGQSFQLKHLFTDAARTWNYGVSIMQVLFDAGKIGYQVSATEWQMVQAYHQYVSTIQTAFREVEDALIAHQKSLELVGVQARRVEALTGYLDLATLQYDNGQTDYLNVLDAQRNLFAAQLDYVQAQGESFLSLVNLYKALGGSWVIEADETAAH